MKTLKVVSKFTILFIFIATGLRLIPLADSSAVDSSEPLEKNLETGQSEISEDHSTNPNSRVFNSAQNCGLQVVRCEQVKSGTWCNPNARIIGGKECYRGEFPWMALLLMSHTRKQFCAGTLLDANHILTANHCVFDFDAMGMARLRVILGEHNIKTTLEGRHQERRVSRIFRHPKWNSKTNENDIAIIKLRRPVNFTNYIQPICLPSISTEELMEDYEGHDIFATIAGWGRRSANPDHTQKSPVPIKTIIPLRDHSQCKKQYLPYHITDNMICAGGYGKDACLGDSGGPMMIKNRYSGRWEQLGVISWGNSCHNLPGVYTRVENYLGWIYNTIK